MLVTKTDQKQAAIPAKMAVKALKFSDRGFTFNERVVYIDAKEIRYYSDPPNPFSKNEFHKLTKVPKVGVPVALVELAYPSEDWLIAKKKKNAIKVIFSQNCQLTYQASGDELIRINKQGKPVEIYDHVAFVKSLPSRKKLEWVFAFRTPQDLHTFIQIVENVTNPDTSVLGKEPRFENRVKAESLQDRDIKFMERLGVPPGEEPDPTVQDQSKQKKVKGEEIDDDDRRARDVQLIKDKIFNERMKEEALLLEEKRRNEAKDLEEMKQQMEQKDKQQTAWKLYYQSYLSECHNLSKVADDIVTNAMRLFKLVNEYAINAQAKLKDIVDDMCFPDNFRKYKPELVIDPEYGLDDDVPMKLLFKDENYFIYISLAEEVDKVSLKEKNLEPYVIEEAARKESQLEFLGYDTINDAILDLGSQLNNRFMVPLCITALYKGFHAIIRANTGIADSDMVYGKKDSDFVQVSTISESLVKLGRYLNIRPHPIKGKILGDISNPDIYFTQRVSMFRANNNPDDFVRRKPAAKNQTNYNDQGEGMYYILNGDGIFPVDVEITQKSKNMRRQRLRPEFIKEYDKKLNPDSLIDGGGSKQIEATDYELSEANKELTTKSLNLLITSLDSMEFLPMDSPGIARVFHEFGVNLRYLGKVVERSRLPHIREFLIAEVIARSVRKILDKSMTHTIYRAGKITDVFKPDIYSGTSPEVIRENFQADFDRSLKQIVVRVLNLTMGSSSESKKYWNAMVKPQVYLDYSFIFPKNFIFEDLPAGALAHACAYHFGIVLRDRIYNVGKTAEPFNIDDILSFKIRPKCYGYRKHKVRNLIGMYEINRDLKDFDMATRLLELKLVVEDNLFREQEYLDNLAEIADICLLKEEASKAVEICNRALKRVSSNSPTAIKFLCVQLKAYIKLLNGPKIQEIYKEAVSLIVYNFGSYHPLHSNFNSFLAYYYFQITEYEKAIEHYQKGLNDCLRILGVDHLLTGQFYLDLASVLLKLDRRDDAIKFLEKAFNIFETAKYNESVEKAVLANQIAVVMYDFGNCKESMDFARKSNSIYSLKSESKYIDKMMDNTLVISKSALKIGDTELAQNLCEEVFLKISKPQIWNPYLGSFVVESLKTVYELVVKEKEYEVRCLIFYIFDMLHSSFNNKKPIRDTHYMERLKQKVEDSRGLKRFLNEVIEQILMQNHTFETANLMNTTYDKFVQKHSRPEVLTVMETMKLLYLTLGADFLLHSLKPVG